LIVSSRDLAAEACLSDKTTFYPGSFTTDSAGAVVRFATYSQLGKGSGGSLSHLEQRGPTHGSGESMSVRRRVSIHLLPCRNDTSLGLV
jgi:hypothetical protein